MPFFDILGAVAGPLIGGLFGGGSSDAQTGAAQAGLDFQKQIWEQTQKNLAPFIGAAPGAVSQWQNLLGIGQGGMGGALDALRQTPGYNFQLNEGLNSILSNATRTGGIGGGNTLKALMGYGQGLADTTYQQALGNIGQFAGITENAAAGLGNTGVSTGANIGNAFSNLGNAQAGGFANTANALTQGVNNLLPILQGGFGGGFGGGPTAFGSQFGDLTSFGFTGG